MNNETNEQNQRVQKIPSTIPGSQHVPLRLRTNLRVAAYCRVSTEQESQKVSYETQKSYYTNWILSHEGWTLVGIYADEGLSGTSTKNRVQFNQMMEDARNGKMDYIVTKSISRFARNTLTAIASVRELQSLTPKVGIYFEKEGVDTLEQSGELALTLYANMAQEESASISRNIRWSIQKNFERGIEHVDLNRFLGYRRDSNGNWVIQESEAKLISEMYTRYVNGESALSIATSLNQRGCFTLNHKVWSASSVLRILRNEKYVGDLIMQKTYTKDYLSHKSLINHGEVPRYYFQNHHPAIIERSLWEKTQAMLEGGKVKAKPHPGRKKAIFSNLREEGYPLLRLTYSTRLSGYRDVRSENFDPLTEIEYYSFANPCWKVRNIESFQSKPYHECALKQSFMEKLYRLKADYEQNGPTSEIGRFQTSLLASFNKKQDETENRQLEKAIALYTNKQAISLCKVLLDSNVNLQNAIKEGEITEESLQKDLYYSLTNEETNSPFKDIQVPESSDAHIYGKLVTQLKQQLRQVEKNQQERIVNEVTVADFKQFLKELESLPEENQAKMKIMVNGRDTDGSLFRKEDGEARYGKYHAAKSGSLKITPSLILKSPDYLEFNEFFYRSFIKSGAVNNDEITYTTTFGFTFTTQGNRRTMSGFMGYKKSNKDGTIEFIDALYKLVEGTISYHRKEKKGNYHAKN